MSWKGSPHTSQSILDKKLKKNTDTDNWKIVHIVQFRCPLLFHLHCNFEHRSVGSCWEKIPFHCLVFPDSFFCPYPSSVTSSLPLFGGFWSSIMIHVSCKRMFFNCRCPADFGSILFLVVVSVWLCQLRRNSNCWICNYLSWERERRHIEWGGEVHTQGLTPPRLLKRSTKPFFHLHWNNSSARTAISTGPSFFPNDIFHNCSS